LLPVVALAMLIPAQAHVHAQTSAPMSDAQLVSAARKAYERADGTLNAVWRQTLRQLDQMDREANDPAHSVTSADLLRDAQRKWLAFRDAECLVHGQLTGGSADRLAYFGCMQSLTEARTRQVRDIATTP